MINQNGTTRTTRYSHNVRADPERMATFPVGFGVAGEAITNRKVVFKVLPVDYVEKLPENIKNRVLQAMALARAIVGTPLVFEGITVENGIHCYKCRTSEEFSQAVITLLADTELRDQIGASARQFVINHFAMEVVGPKWLALYKNAIAKFKTRR